MQAIGWTFLCALVASIAFEKTAATTRIEQIEYATNSSDSHDNVIARLFPILRLDDDVQRAKKLVNDLFYGENEAQDATLEEGRTFGLKRIQFMLMPMMYKMGVMMTLLTVLIVISLKGLLIGAILLMFKVSSFIAKFQTGWHQQAPTTGWPQQPIHVHVHNMPPYGHHQAYHGWLPPATASGDDDHYYYRARSETS